MILTEFRNRFRAELTPIYGEPETDSFFSLILEHLHGMTRVDLALRPELPLTGELLARWTDILGRLRQQQPIQYILGEAHFYGRRFRVTSDVLIPRQETEELVQWILSDKRPGAPAILDIGTGSGCIAISLAAEWPEAAVSAIDVSPGALEVASRNASAAGVSIQFHEIDILRASSSPGSFDVIVSNPPYVRVLEKHEIKPNVLDHEPHLALFVDDDDPLLFYRKIAQLAAHHLKPGGKLYFEINQYLGQATVNLLKQYFQHVELRKDIYGNDRMICAYS